MRTVIYTVLPAIGNTANCPICRQKLFVGKSPNIIECVACNLKIDAQFGEFDRVTIVGKYKYIIDFKYKVAYLFKAGHTTPFPEIKMNIENITDIQFILNKLDLMITFQ